MRAVHASASLAVVCGAGATPGLPRAHALPGIRGGRLLSSTVVRSSFRSMFSSALPPRNRRASKITRLAPAAALTPASAFAVGSLFDGAVGVAVASVLGGAIAALAERLWSKRHLSELDITHSDAPGNLELLNACTKFHTQYDAVDALRNTHACTIAVSLFRQDLRIEYQREVLRMPDGGHVTLDWPIEVDGKEIVGAGVGTAVPSSSEESSKESSDLSDTIRQLQYGNGDVRSSDAANSLNVLGSEGPDGVPGVIGISGGGGSDGCGSGGGGCDPLANANTSATGPHRKSIPDQGKTILRKRLAEHWRQLPDDAPVLILMSGIAGGSHDKYLKHFLKRAHFGGYRCVAFNCRGTANSPLTTPQFYSASFTGDIREVVDELKGRWPDSKMFATGWSLGANILTNFLGEEGVESKLDGAVAMCNPFDLNACDNALQDGVFGTIYSRSMAKNMRLLFSPHAHLFAGLPNYKRELVEAATTVRDFDEAVTRVTFGFPSVDAYYDASSSRRLIGNVKVPLLVVQAKDDPIAVHSAVPREVIRNMSNNSNVLLVETESGGHLGWSAGAEAPFGAPWPDEGAMQFLEAVRGGAHLVTADRNEAEAVQKKEVASAR